MHALIRPGADRERIAELAGRLAVVEGDVASLADPARVARIEPEICLHLAWYAEPGRYLHAVEENLSSLRAGLDLAEALAAAGCRRMVVTGTCAEYGSGTPDAVFEETAPLRPATPYARAKAALYLAAQDTAAKAGMSLSWARLFFLYGPWEHPGRIVPSAIRACLRHEAFPATGGEQVRDYLQVGDAAAALWAIARSEIDGPVNVSAGEATTLRSLLESVEDATGARGTIRFGEVPYGPAEWMWMRGANAKLRQTGWRPSHTLQSGVADTVAWWRRRLAGPSAGRGEPAAMIPR